MKIKEFLNYFDFSKLNSTQGLLIPVKNECQFSIKNPLDFEICDDVRKIILDDYEYGFVEDYDFFVDKFGIKPKRQSENEDDEEYEYLDFDDLDNGFYSILDENDNVWIYYEIN